MRPYFSLVIGGLMAVGALDAYAQAEEAPAPQGAKANEQTVDKTQDIAADEAANASQAAKTADAPPPSTYDMMRQQTPEKIREQPSLFGQFAKTLVALLIVVALIYLVFKLGLARYLQARFGGQPKGKTLEIIDQVSISPRQRVFVVRVGERKHWLVGSSEGSPMTLLSELDPQDVPVGSETPSESVGASHG